MGRSKELWKDIEGYEGLYKISNRGRVKSLQRVVPRKRWGGFMTVNERILVNFTVTFGYPAVKLQYKGEKRTIKVHRLLAIAFMPNPLNKPFINHKDCNPSNLKIRNLEWCTHKENIAHSARLGRMVSKMKGEKHKRSKITDKQVKEINNLLKKGKSVTEIAKMYSVSTGPIYNIRSKKRGICI